jgi:hypothetical protein
MILGYLWFYRAGVSCERSIVDKKNARKKIQPKKSNLSKPRIQQVNQKESLAHNQSLSLRTFIHCSTRASKSQGK